jgi:hypothetical protein
MSWRVLITARTLDEAEAAALKLLEGSGCELIIPRNYALIGRKRSSRCRNISTEGPVAKY